MPEDQNYFSTNEKLAIDDASRLRSILLCASASKVRLADDAKLDILVSEAAGVSIMLWSN